MNFVICLAVKVKIWKLALTRTTDHKQSTSINFVQVNGRSLYTVGRRMVVVVVVEGVETIYTM